MHSQMCALSRLTFKLVTEDGVKYFNFVVRPSDMFFFFFFCNFLYCTMPMFNLKYLVMHKFWFGLISVLRPFDTFLVISGAVTLFLGKPPRQFTST